MDSKLNCTFKQAFNFFINKERIISSQNADILYGLKSKNEYINEQKFKLDAKPKACINIKKNPNFKF